MKVQKILFQTDFSETASAALSRALFLAESLEAELHMLHAVVLHEFDSAKEGRGFPGSDDILRQLFEIADSNMARLLKQHGREMLTIRQERRRGISAPAVILEYADEIDADLIVMGTHGRRGPARVFLGSVAETVTRHATCPVLIVGSEVKSLVKGSMPTNSSRLLTTISASVVSGTSGAARGCFVRFRRAGRDTVGVLVHL